MPHSGWLVLWSPPHAISGSCMAGKCCPRLGRGHRQVGRRRACCRTPCCSDSYEMRGGDRSLAPRLAITEPKLSPVRGIVVSMSFQHKINCTAHQPSGSQHSLAASTSSQKELPRCDDKSASCSQSWEWPFRPREHGFVIWGPSACLKGHCFSLVLETAPPGCSPIC